jgi:hypothetical protein
MKYLKTYKLMEKNESEDLLEVIQTIKDICLELDDYHGSTIDYNFGETDKFLSWKYKNTKSDTYNYLIRIWYKSRFFNEILEIVQRIEDYVKGLGYEIKISTATTVVDKMFLISIDFNKKD